MIISKVKSYLIFIMGIAFAVTYKLLNRKTAKVEELKHKAIKVQLQAAEKQRQQATKALTALRRAEKEGAKRVEQAIQEADAGIRRDFD